MTAYQNDLLIETWVLCDEHLILTQVMLAFMEEHTGLSVTDIVVFLASEDAIRQRSSWSVTTIAKQKKRQLPGSALN